MTPEKRYARREHVYDKVRAKHQRLANRLSNDRLTSVLLGFAVSGFVFRAFSHGMGAALGLLTLILFGYLALTHRRVRSQLTYAEALRDINRRGMERVTGRWTSFTESGAEVKDDHHPYASDLDLFGQASLFQWINSAHTNLGQETLAEFLKKTPDAPAEIMAGRKPFLNSPESWPGGSDSSQKECSCGITLSPRRL